jgi:hypothetical protein
LGTRAAREVAAVRESPIATLDRPLAVVSKLRSVLVPELQLGNALVFEALLRHR